MVTLTILQQGNSTYTAAQAVTQQFDPNKISKTTLISGNTQFVYFGETYIVDELVATIFSGINYLTLNVTENNVTTANVSFNLNCVQMVQNVGGAAGVTYSIDPTSNQWRSTGFAVSTSTSSYAAAIATMVTQGFAPVTYYIPINYTVSTTPTYSYVNLSAIESIVTTDEFREIMLPNGTILYAVLLQDYELGAVFEGISGTDRLKSITINGASYVINLLCVSGANKTAIAAALTTLVQTTLGAVSGTITCTAPNSGEMQIVIPATSIIPTIAIATISAVDTTEAFVVV